LLLDALMKTLNLALQGGGSHGAFTWGVLDALLADERIVLEGLSGASAGAVNAVTLASGYAKALAAGRDPRAGAREALAHLWNELMTWSALGSLQARFSHMLWGGLPQEFAPTNIWANAFQGLFSPYQANPLDINPLLSLLEREIDFAAIAANPKLKVFVSATHVNTGKAVIFSGRQLTAQAVMASACLPLLFKAVEIGGEAYWDGGYAVNPALTPLVQACRSSDLMVVQINPLKRDHAPHSAGEILDRVNELTFNASLLTQMRSIDFVNRLLAEGSLRSDRRKLVLLHRIDGGDALKAYSASSKTSADATMIRALFDIGQAAARQWLARHYDALGHHGTVDVRRDYLDDTREELPPHPGATNALKGFRPWLARLFKRSKNI
jgi:NTE family protein